MASSQERKAIIVGISGASCSGKTTLARLLRDIFPNSFVIHEDDFYKPEAEIPIHNGVPDWDCAGALAIPEMAAALEHVVKHGEMPSSFESKEDRNPAGNSTVPSSILSNLKARVSKWTAKGEPGYDILLSPDAPRLCLLDGFLLYSPSMAAIQPHLGVRLFLRVSYECAKKRREGREGYATIEGWWTDPPGYVDKIVWPAYVGEHSWMFKDGNVEGSFDESALEREGVRAQVERGQDVPLEVSLEWAVEEIIRGLEEAARAAEGREG